MPLNHFIRQADEFGTNKQPFFFLIDFERQKPVICPPEQAEKHGISFQIAAHNNRCNRLAPPASPFSLSMQPMPFADYRRGFDIVHQALQNGNSYLLNLTYPTEIHINYHLNQLFLQSEAKYKLLFKDEFVCFSPETFVKIEHNKIYTYPMKGTINAALHNAERQLLDSQKELREHYTIVDLMRNDLAIVAKNIKVNRFRYVEKIHRENGAILQTSSEICGDLADNWQANIGSLLAALLPAGSISGAPKEKTVDIIRRAEGQPRGYYTGIFGIFNGDSLQSAVAIRFIERRQNRYYFRSGGGITIHSDAYAEYRELLEKVDVPLRKV
ncbi:aminodeoxychorismate synthase component I [Necropsobacter massiliensis]|uniref:aminodeoxychorismate synthase component I n=1 Tax=Necropsobacter massiliensis TaxID=1400001 RepID=UPI000595D028|nr:aminodeoxychorismate synthase component I [Necropsobacter massiliensis]